GERSRRCDRCRLTGADRGRHRRGRGPDPCRRRLRRTGLHPLRARRRPHPARARTARHYGCHAVRLTRRRRRADAAPRAGDARGGRRRSAAGHGDGAPAHPGGGVGPGDGVSPGGGFSRTGGRRPGGFGDDDLGDGFVCTAPRARPRDLPVRGISTPPDGVGHVYRGTTTSSEGDTMTMPIGGFGSAGDPAVLTRMLGRLRTSFMIQGGFAIVAGALFLVWPFESATAFVF